MSTGSLERASCAEGIGGLPLPEWGWSRTFRAGAALRRYIRSQSQIR
jgi:hypothetical protein